MAPPPPRLWTRRRVLCLIGASAGAGALVLACRSEDRAPEPGSGAVDTMPRLEPVRPTAAPTPTPSPTPSPTPTP